mmetsp:Transcript_13623/g.30231  ORF Transcript_13623/g.30231 Transcript_13623/m.30231 type:complete len:142 (+) Transcript_13623:697-1122(+)
MGAASRRAATTRRGGSCLQAKCSGVHSPHPPVVEQSALASSPAVSLARRSTASLHRALSHSLWIPRSMMLVFVGYRSSNQRGWAVGYLSIFCLREHLNFRDFLFVCCCVYLSLTEETIGDLQIDYYRGRMKSKSSEHDLPF